MTLNPSIDYVVEVNIPVKLCAPGGGSSSDAVWRMKSCALGCIAGFTGDALETGLLGIQPDFLIIRFAGGKQNQRTQS